MKSVKNKLFVAYTITIFVILFFLSIFSVYYFENNKKTNSLKELDLIYLDITKNVEMKNDEVLKNIDSLVALKQMFLIILKDDEILFSNQSNYKTNKILDEIDFKEKGRDKSYERFENKRKKEIEELYEDYESDGYLEVDDYVMSISYLEKEDNLYEVYLGIDDRYIQKSLEDIYGLILTFSIILFLFLIVLGYFLIHKTLKPLKQILIDVKTLQNRQDISLRLQEQKSKDEFEELTNTFNNMLDDIEKNVENIKQFSSDVSHELKTPLTVIQCEIELCNRDNKNEKQLQNSIMKIDKEQKRLQNIIQDFLLLARLDKDFEKTKNALLDKVIFDSIEQNLDLIESKNLELKIEIDENLEVNFNEKYLFIVINNLLTNAIKYTEEGYIKLYAYKQKDKVIFEIEDSGIGIESKDIKNIYERFFRVDKVRTTSENGIGLGLAIVKKICDKFDTKINVKSEITVGTTFKVEMKTKG